MLPDDIPVMSENKIFLLLSSSNWLDDKMFLQLFSAYKLPYVLAGWSMLYLGSSSSSFDFTDIFLGVATANHSPPSVPVLCIFLQHTSYLNVLSPHSWISSLVFLLASCLVALSWAIFPQILLLPLLINGQIYHDTVSLCSNDWLKWADRYVLFRFTASLPLMTWSPGNRTQ